MGAGVPPTGGSAGAASGYVDAVAQLQRALTFGIHPSLDGIRALADALARPQDSFASVQVTGTNGKTSVTRLTEAILRAEGFLAGAYTSPHLVSYTERIEVGGGPVSEVEFARAVFAATDAAERLGGEYTEFELLTAAALWLFRERKVDFAVLEVGMGGRWDATSVVSPAVAVITGVGLDHTDRLGDTVEEIAADKAHIIKPASAPVLGPGTAAVASILLDPRRVALDSPAFRRRGVAAHARTRRPHGAVPRHAAGRPRQAPRLTLEVRGIHATYPGLSLVAPAYQAPNVAVAIAAAEAAVGRALDLEALRAALSAVTFPGRFEVVRREPPLVLDGAHNPQAAAVLASALADAFGDDPPIAVLGVLADKDAAGMVAALAPHVSRFVCTRPDSPRALPARELAALVERSTGAPCESHETVAAALEAVLAAGEAAVVTGSLYTAGEARALLLGAGRGTRQDESDRA